MTAPTTRSASCLALAFTGVVALVTGDSAAADDTNSQDCHVPGPPANCCHDLANETFFKECGNGETGFTCVGIIISDDLFQPRRTPSDGDNGWGSDTWAIVLPFSDGPLCEFRPPLECVFTGTAPACTHSNQIFFWPCPEFLGGEVECTFDEDLEADE